LGGGASRDHSIETTWETKVIGCSKGIGGAWDQSREGKKKGSKTAGVIKATDILDDKADEKQRLFVKERKQQQGMVWKKKVFAPPGKAHRSHHLCREG